MQSNCISIIRLRLSFFASSPNTIKTIHTTRNTLPLTGAFCSFQFILVAFTAYLWRKFWHARLRSTCPNALVWVGAGVLFAAIGNWRRCWRALIRRGAAVNRYEWPELVHFAENRNKWWYLFPLDWGWWWLAEVVLEPRLPLQDSGNSRSLGIL